MQYPLGNFGGQSGFERRSGTLQMVVNGGKLKSELRGVFPGSRYNAKVHSH